MLLSVALIIIIIIWEIMSYLKIAYDANTRRFCNFGSKTINCDYLKYASDAVVIGFS